jgi:hypothetical protein
MKLDLSVGSINVNSFNLSTVTSRNSKTFLKIEGATRKKQDVLFFSDCRIADKEKEFTKLMGLNMNCSYKVYINSNKDSRGVCIAIKRKIFHEVIEIFKSEDQNIILMKVKIKGHLLVLGSIYGPNVNDVEFFRGLRRKVEDWNLPYILGGDFNTVLDSTVGAGNLDREGGGRPPNPNNGREIREWIGNGDCFEPFRALYPEQHEISYLPFRGREGGNPLYGKSRLDFFLINRDMIEKVRYVRYEDRLSLDFDHKMVSLDIGKKSQPGKINIFKGTLSHELAEYIGHVHVLDTVNNHAVYRNDELGIQIGRILRQIDEYMMVEAAGYKSGNHLAGQGRLIELLGIIRIGVDELPSIGALLEQNFNCNWTSLYDVAVINLKTKIMELQGNIKKNKECRRETLVKKMNYMGETFGIGSEQANDSIRELNLFDNNELRERANKYREFVMSTDEKPSRAFCLLGKENNMLDDMNQIKDREGGEFTGKDERKEYIRKFYENLYKKKLDNMIRIEDFLGGEVSNLGWVNNKKLSEEEKLSLEGEVTLEELLKALKSSNLNSSNGWDGVSYQVLAKFFVSLGPLLVKLANECFLRGELSETFRLGIIKLIPKKGEASKVEDWRPITLLCCGYKLISGVVANRLEKYLGKITGRAQKGFLKSKSMSTCTINIMDRIAGSWENMEKTGILCVDFVKAFDSIEHEYICRVLGFFNFGGNFTRMVSTLLNNRLARVLVNNEYSETFKIGRGTPQGDRASPFIFILCIEILLIKIKSKTNRGIRNTRYMEVWCENNGLMDEGTSEGFADDITLMFGYDEGSLATVLGIMDQFASTSGLQLNKNKTQLMIVGSDEIGIGEVVQGIKIVGEVKILGVKIDRKLQNLDLNWNEAIQKMERIANFWGLQRLNITGRVLVAKTFMLSQVTFLLGSLCLNFELGERINNIMANFVKGHDRIIAKQRWCLDRELGGYGLINVHVMNICIKASWINRWIHQPESIDLNGRRTGIDFDQPVDQWCVNMDNVSTDPQTTDILRQWKIFKRCYYRCKGNAVYARMFSNDGLLEGIQDIGIEVFGRVRYERLGAVAKNVRLGDMIRNGMILDKDAVEIALGERVNMAEYFRLRNICRRICEVLDVTSDEGTCLDDWIRAKKRRGGTLRRVISGKNSPLYVENDPRAVPSAVSLWGNNVAQVNRLHVELNFGLWGVGQLSAGYKMFLFNLMQGKLYLNNVLFHLGQESNKCTFCTIVSRKELMDRNIAEDRPEYQYYLSLLPVETVEHIFWQCEHVQMCINQCYRWIRGYRWYDGVETIDQQSFFIGVLKDTVNKKITQCDLLWKHFVKFFIYQCRSQKKLPRFPSLKFEMEGIFCSYKMVEWRQYITRINELYED